jgi:hypothetical protein
MLTPTEKRLWSLAVAARKATPAMERDALRRLSEARRTRAAHVVALTDGADPFYDDDDATPTVEIPAPTAGPCLPGKAFDVPTTFALSRGVVDPADVVVLHPATTLDWVRAQFVAASHPASKCRRGK